MESIITYFQDPSPLVKLSWMFSALILAWILEALIPLVNHGYNKVKHVGINFVFLLSDLTINVVVGLATAGIFLWIDSASVGVLGLVELPIWIKIFGSVLVLDFVAQYCAHYLLHKVKWMWKFHLVHHSDTHVDATTGTRHHPGDYLIREIFSLATIVIFGIPIAYYLIYRFLSVVFTYTIHANIQFPKWFDKLMSLVFITPDMHKFHHHFERPWTDSNLGNIFSLWDRMFGTLVYDDPKKIQYGLDVTDGTRDEDLKYQFGLPFNKSIKTDY